MDNNQGSQREQRFLKTLYKIQRWGSRILLWLFYLSVPFFLILSIYYGFCQQNGMDVGNRFSSSFAAFLMIGGACAAGKLLSYILDKVHQREIDFDPQTMNLPDLYSINLETALHTMAIKTAVITWDTIFSVLILSLLLLMAMAGGNKSLILLICLILAALLLLGHFLFSLYFKKRHFSGRMLKNTKKYIPLSDPEEYTASVEKSLLNSIRYYAKELILTDDFIIGNTEADTQFHPVAVPRSEIAAITFYCRRPVMNRYRKFDTGILKCRLSSGKAVEFLIGQNTRMERVLKVLNHYQIEWRDGTIVYE